MSEQLDRKPEGLLSLMYWVKNDKRYHEAFHLNMLDTMERYFGIPPSSPIATKVLEISKAHANPEKAIPLVMALFRDHLLEDAMWGEPKFW